MDSFEHIQLLKQQWNCLSDQEVLTKLAALHVLPDEDDASWENEETWYNLADAFTALADISEQRKLRAAIPLLLEKASYGDPGEMMRGLRHCFEWIINPDWKALADICVRTAQYPQRGARLWSVHQLGTLRELHTLDVLLEALRDTAKLVRKEACLALYMLCQQHPACRYRVSATLLQVKESVTDEDEQAIAQWAHKAIQELV